MTENQANQTEASEAESMDLDSSKVSSTASHSLADQEDTLPTWWKRIFLATVLFCPPYLFWHYCGASGRTLAEQYDVALAANMKLQFGEIGELSLTEDNVIKYLYEDSWLKVGRAVFKSNCVSCHGSDGGGLVGPNLCDDSYKNVKQIGDILKVLQKGANGGAMPAWQSKLSPNEIVLVSSYVASLRGSNPSVAKPAEGREIDPWPSLPEVELSDESEEQQNESE